MKILLSNDDGIDSVALLPTIRILETVGEVTTVVPMKNQSWTSKANTRSLKPIKKEIVERDGYEIITLDALPADCSNYGLFMNDKLPDLLVTGANLGHNVGLSAFLSSGTVGAALEGLLVGVPSISVSTPYSFGEEMTEEKFTKSVSILKDLVPAFLESRPDNFAMLTTNLPLGYEHHGLIAATMDRWIFGKLFDDGDGFVKPRNYPDLNQVTEAKPMTDTWGKDNRVPTVIALDRMAQIIDRQLVENWLKEINLHHNLN